MPVIFSQVNSIPDFIASNRHQLSFPSVRGIDGNALMLRHSEITLPNVNVAHIRVRLFRSPVGFRGGTSFSNVLTVSFFEDSKGTSFNNLNQWMTLVRNPKTGTGGLKSEYASDANLRVFDTMGKVVYNFQLLNIFPLDITMFELGEDSSAAKISVQFNVDAVDVLNVSPQQASSGRSGSTQAFRNQFDYTDTATVRLVSLPNATGLNTVRKALSMFEFAREFASVFK